MQPSGSIRFKAIAAAVVVLTAVGIAPVATPSASAAIVPVEGCSLEGLPLVIDVDDSTLDPFDGGWYALADAEGNAVNHTQPLGTAAVGPVCILPVVDGALDSSQATWAFCTQTASTHAACVEGALTDRTPALDADQIALASWIIADEVFSDFFTTESLMQTQEIVECITAGAPVSIPGFADCDEIMEFLEFVALPNMVDDESTISVTASPTAGRFTVSSSMQILHLLASDETEFELCPGQSGAELMGDQLAVEQPGTAVEICTDGGPGTTLVASSLFPLIEVGSFVGHDGSTVDQPCAIFLTESSVGDVLLAQATSPSAPAPTPTPTTTTTTPSRRGASAARTPAPLSFAG